MNSAYLQVVHSFTSEYIPYLRDEHNKRLKRISAPYGIDVPPEVYQRFLDLDERENRGNESQAFLSTFYGEGNCYENGHTPEPENMVDLTHELNFRDRKWLFIIWTLFKWFKLGFYVISLKFSSFSAHKNQLLFSSPSILR